MRLLFIDNREGGQSGLPFPLVSGIERRNLLRLLSGIFLPLALSLALGGQSASAAQNRAPKGNRLPKVTRAERLNNAAALAAKRQNQARLAQQREAVKLLRMMLRPLEDYAGEETTWVATQNGITSHQSIKGDTNGNVIRYYTAPAFLQGDVMLTGPNRYIYYRAATKTVTRTSKAGQGDERDKQIMEGIRSKTFVASLTGNEMVAGRNAAIVLVSSVNPQNRGYAKIWIDPVDHIKLKIEIGNAEGYKISDSEITSIQSGAAAGVTPKDFQPAEFGNGPAREIKREKLGSIQEAAGQLTFRPLEPGNLPPGFRLNAVILISPPIQNRAGKNSLLLRYTDGVASFTLNEHPARRAGAAANNNGPAAPLRWEMGNVEVVYRGHLPPQQEQMIHDSLRPVN
jgi:hypothetical protein